MDVIHVVTVSVSARVTEKVSWKLPDLNEDFNVRRIVMVIAM